MTRSIFSPIHDAGFRPGQWVTANGRTAVVVGWRSKRRGARRKSLVVKLTGKGPDAGTLRAVDFGEVTARKGKRGRGPLGRVA